MLVAVLVFGLGFHIASSQFNNYHNWPEIIPPSVKTETHDAGKETKIRCQIKDRFRHIQKGLNLTWERKPCTSGHITECINDETHWKTICGPPLRPCPPILTLVEPRSQDSGLYRCHITFDSSVIVFSVYMLKFNERLRLPPVIVEGMNSNISVVAPLLTSLQCKVRSPVVPTVRWFRRLPHAKPQEQQPSLTQTLVQHLNKTYQLLDCCPLATLLQKDTYLSKLVIPTTTVFDTGYYICLAINDANYTFKEAYINVIHARKSTGENTEDKSLLELFIIPAVFILIPVIIWILCHQPRKETKLKLASVY